MNLDHLLKVFVAYLIFSGLAKSLIVTILYTAGAKDRGERHVHTMSNWGGFFDVALIGGVYLCGFQFQFPQTISFGDLFRIHSDFIFYTEQVSLAYLLASFIVLGLVGRFSCFYLHKDKLW